MQILRYRLANNTLNSVFGGDFNKTITTDDMFEGAEVVFGERYG
jgi:hypothetical protein